MRMTTDRGIVQTPLCRRDGRAGGGRTPVFLSDFHHQSLGWERYTSVETVARRHRLCPRDPASGRPAEGRALPMRAMWSQGSTPPFDRYGAATGATRGRRQR